MANLYITYFKKLGEDDRGNVVPIGELPDEGGQRVVYTVSTQSGLIPKYARFVRLLADADAYIALGTSPTATAQSNLKLEADVAEYFGLNPHEARKGTLKLAVYDGST